MAGIKGRSGGSNKKSLREHLREGSYRKTRHGPIPDELRHLLDEGRGSVVPFRAPSAFKVPGEPVNAAPSPPDWLPRGARARWTELAPAVHAAGRLTELDVPAFAGLCVALAELSWASKQRQRFAAKGEKMHGVIAYRLKCIAMVRSMAVEFGLTPASRCRVEELVPLVAPVPAGPRPTRDGKPVLTRLGTPT